MSRGATHTWHPPQRGPKESAEHYIRVLEGRIDAMTKSMQYETRDRKLVIENRIAACQKAMIEAIRSKG